SQSPLSRASRSFTGPILKGSKGSGPEIQTETLPISEPSRSLEFAHSRPQILDQPTPRAADFVAADVNDMGEELEGAELGELELFQPPLRDRPLDEMGGHSAPAEAGQQKFEPGRQVGEAPDMVADDAAAEILGQRRPVGQNELDVRLEGLAGDRLRLLRQRVVDADDGDDVDRGEKISHQVAAGSGRRRRIDRELRDAVAQALLR